MGVNLCQMDQSIQSNLVTKEKKIYTGTAARILKLLGEGHLPVEAARAVGCDESLVSQLRKEPDFIEQVNELVKQTFAAQSKIDANYIETERILSDRLRESAQFIFNPNDVVRTLKFVNEAKKKIPTAFNPDANGDGAKKPVTLIMPVTLINKFIMNPNNEIVAVDGKDLSTLPSGNMRSLVEKHKQEEARKPILLEHKNGSRHQDPWSDL